MNGGQTMLTLSELVVYERWTNYAHFVRVGGLSTVDKLCSFCQHWGSMNGGQTMLTLSELGVCQRWTNYAHFVSFGGL